MIVGAAGYCGIISKAGILPWVGAITNGVLALILGL